MISDLKKYSCQNKVYFIWIPMWYFFGNLDIIIRYVKGFHDFLSLWNHHNFFSKFWFCRTCCLVRSFILAFYVKTIKTLIVSTVFLCFPAVPLPAVPLSAFPPAVPELLHCLIQTPQTFQIQFSPISRGGMNWSVCRV